MQVLHQLDAWHAIRRDIDPRLSLGFVPTMGNLHQGHASLMAASKQANDVTIVSLFINPTQFNRPDDFTHYPRTLEDDLALLEEQGVDYCLLPTEQDVYADAYRYRIDEIRLSQVMEGLHRPGHFNGVLTVVMKLLNITRPTVAYFGEKDYQQYQLIRGMAQAFFMPVSIEVCPTIREASGLAFSSRNNRLNPAQRQRAETFARLFHQNLPAAQIDQQLRDAGITVVYVLEHEGRRYAAVEIDGIRLIDNYAIQNASPMALA